MILGVGGDGVFSGEELDDIDGYRTPADVDGRDVCRVPTVLELGRLVRRLGLRRRLGLGGGFGLRGSTSAGVVGEPGRGVSAPSSPQPASNDTASASTTTLGLVVIVIGCRHLSDQVGNHSGQQRGVD